MGTDLFSDWHVAPPTPANHHHKNILKDSVDVQDSTTDRTVARHNAMAIHARTRR